MNKETIPIFENDGVIKKDYSEADKKKRFEIFNEITNNKLFSYKVKMAIILLNKQEAFDILKEDLTKSMVIDGAPSAICTTAFQELYETKVWYIPDRLKFWDRRFGEVLKYPFLVYDDDVNTWSKVLKENCTYSTPKKEDYTSIRIYNRDWEFWAEMIAVAAHDFHPLFEESYHILKERGLPDKVLMKKQEELKILCMPDNQRKYGIEHFGYAKVW